MSDSFTLHFLDSHPDMLIQGGIGGESWGDFMRRNEGNALQNRQSSKQVFFYFLLGFYHYFSFLFCVSFSSY